MSTDKVQPESDEEPESGPERYKRLPERVRAQDIVETVDTRVPPDPEGGRDTDRDFMIRYSGG